MTNGMKNIKNHAKAITRALGQKVNSVVEMFKRSEELYGTKYAYYIGDGDSKTFKGITDSAPYENLIVKKKSVSITFRSVWAHDFEI